MPIVNPVFFSKQYRITMANWFSFLEAQGATLTASNTPEVTSFGEAPAQYPQLISQTLLFSLDDRGSISCSGQDTDKLLQGQLTCDIRQLSESRSLKGALCTVQGRMVSDLQLCRLSSGDTLLVTHRGLVIRTLETLKKFAVFYKTSLADRSDDYQLLGLAGPEAKTLAQQLTGQTASDDNCLQGDGLALLQLGPQRWLAIVPADRAQAVWQQLSAEAKPAGLPLWRWLAICDGDGEVHPETTETFIPQMLNLQHTDAINFKKGCYTGQEIVARMQYLGKLKRRMYRLALNSPAPLPGSPIHLANGRECGTAVLSAPAGQEQWQLLAVLTEEAAAADVLRLGDDELAVQTLSLPYDAAFNNQQTGS
ncbi:MAG: hypothetical protein M0Q49_05005 [Porticoccaceae bacterium]|nr:hypothetical protein [Porticoccaceae bacterium]